MNEKLSEAEDFLYGFRKILAFSAVLLIGSIFRIKGLVDGPGFVDLIKNTFLAFAAGNSVEHFVSMGKQYIQSKVSSQTAAAPGATDDSSS